MKKKYPRRTSSSRLLLVAFLITATLTSFRNLNAQSVSFTSSGLVGESLVNPTTLDFGPDGRLYVAQQNGNIYAYTIAKTGPNSYQVINTETILLVKNIPNHDDDGALNTSVTNRQITGILAVGTPLVPILFVCSSDPRIGGGGTGGDLNLDTNSGVISKLTKNGSSWTKVDVVKGLPRSEENHANNGMVLDHVSNTLYVAVGGHTNAGSPSNNFAFITEYALSAAILKIDLTHIAGLPGGSYDLPTLDDPDRSGSIDANDPFGGNDGLNQAKIVPGGPVQIHSPGYRNSYDLVLTTTPGISGRMYTIDNGANGGWGGHPANEGASGNPLSTTVTNNYVAGEPGSNGPGTNDAKVNNLDNLHYVSGPGFGPIYGGHPNPIRANPQGAGLYWYNNTTTTAHFELNPTSDWPPVPISMANPVEGDFRNPGVDDGALHTWPASTNGLAEYTATTFNGAMAGNLLAASFDGSIYRIQLNASGTATTNVSALFSGFGSTPLDVIAQGDNEIFPGTIWAATYGSNNITVFEPPASGGETWSDVTYNNGTSPLLRHENGFVESGGKFYLIGGRGNKSVGIYDPVTKIWTSGAQPPIQLHHFQAVVYQNKIYLICAFTGNYPSETPVDKIYIYDIQLNSWSDGPTIPVNRRRGSAGVVLYENKFYIAGGLTNGHVNGWVNWLDQFDPVTGVWTQLANTPQARDHFHAAVINEKLYLAGGRRTGESGVFGATIANVDVYDFASNAWSTPTQIPTPRGAPGVTVNNNQLIVVGGEVANSSSALSVVESYNPVANSWTTKPPMNVGRHGTQLINLGGTLFIAAGSTTQGGGGETNTMSTSTYSMNCSGVDSDSLDDDQDGYRNADEIDNGTDPCSAASRPEDNDQDLVSNLNDPDDDNDGVNDILDKFALDSSNGLNTTLPIDYPFLNGNPGFGLFGVGFTGLMTNNVTNYANNFDPNHPDLIVGGAVGVVSVPANGNNAVQDNQQYAFQFGVNINQSTPPVTIQSKLLGAPFFDGLSLQQLSTHSQGIYFGTGDQNNYFKLVLHANGGNPGFQVLCEQNGSVAFQQIVPVSGILNSEEIELFINVNPSTGEVTCFYKRPSDLNPISIGGTFLVTGSILTALQSSNQAVAVGIIASSGNTNSFSASWDFMKVIPTNGAAVTTVIRINSGGPAVQFGSETWAADQYFSGGSAYTSTAAIGGTVNDALYQTERFGNFSYSIPVPQSGQYLVELHFAEIYWGVANTTGPDKRVFNVNVENGKFVRSNIDLAKEFGPATAVTIPATVNVTDGVLNISLTTVLDNAKLSGVSVFRYEVINNAPFVINPFPNQVIPVTQSSLSVPLNQIFNDDNGVANLSFEVRSISNPSIISATQITGTQLAITFNSQIGTTNIVLRATDGGNKFVESTFQIQRTSDNQTPPGLVQLFRINSGGPAVQFGSETWAADQYFSGGSAYTSTAAIGGTVNDALYQTERFGNFSYSIPVPQSGQYLVELHFAEIYWGVANTTGPDKRVFNVNVENGKFVRSNIDLAKEFGPATAVTIPATVNVTDGVLNISLTTVLDNAKISGVSVFRYEVINNPPFVINPFPNQVIPVTQSSLSVPLNQIFNDDNGLANLSFEVRSISNPSIISATQITGTQLAITFNSQTGTSNIVLRATDGGSKFVESTFQIQRTNDNQTPPGLVQLFRINSGGPAVQFGSEVWAADQYFSGGSAYTSTAAIGGTVNDALYQTERFGNFSYSIPVPQSGQYLVELHFAEIYWGVANTTGPDKRVFNVNVENGKFVRSNIDLAKEFGPATAVIIPATVNVTDGVLNISLTTVLDNAKLSGVSVFRYEVNNNPPVVTTPPNTSLSEGEYWSYQVIASDPDAGDVLTYSALNLPASLVINQITGIISGTIEVTPGTFPVTLTVTDQKGRSVNRNFVITINPASGPPTNNPPVASVTVQASYCRNTQVSIPIIASDADGDNLSFSIDASGNPLPPGLSLNPSTGLISGLLQKAVNEGTSTSYGVVVKVTDTKGASVNVLVNIFSIDCGGGLQVTSLVLINSITDTELFALTNGMVLYTNNLPSSINVKANVTPQPGSVRFGWQSNANYRTENAGPYALAGDINGNYNNLALGAGTYSITATPYPNASAGGTAGQALSLTFTVISGSGSQARIAGTDEDEAIRLTEEIPESILVYPNPAQDQFTVKVNVKEQSTWDFVFYNSLGTQLPLGSFDLAEGIQVIDFDLKQHSLSPGLYYLNVTNSLSDKKFIKVAIKR